MLAVYAVKKTIMLHATRRGPEAIPTVIKVSDA